MTENTFSILHEEDTELLREEEELPQIFKIDTDEKKICEGKGSGRIRKIHSEKKVKRETGPKPELSKTMKGTKIRIMPPL